LCGVVEDAFVFNESDLDDSSQKKFGHVAQCSIAFVFAFAKRALFNLSPVPEITGHLVVKKRI